MTLARLHSALRRTLGGFSFRSPAAQQSRLISSTSPCLDEENNGGDGLGHGSEGDEKPESSSSEINKVEVTERVKPPPYANELRKIMVAKYLSNQPIARPHPLCDQTSEKVSLQELRTQYKRRVAAVRKQYIFELERKREIKAAQDRKEREKILLAKQERLRLKKEKSEQRAIEVAEEKRILQEQLTKEREEKRAYRKLKDQKIEERKQQGRDLIRQKSGNWIQEKDLEERIILAYLNPTKL